MIIFWAVLYFFIQRDGQFLDLGNWFEQNMVYVGFIFVSIRLWLTSLQYDTRKPRFILITLIVINILVWYLFVFNKNFEVLSLAESLILGVGIGLVFLLMMIHHWIKYILSFFVIGGFLIFLLLKTLPMYEESPDIEWFIDSRENLMKTIVLEPNNIKTTVLLLKGEEKKEFDIWAWNIETKLDLEEKTTITLSSKKYHEKSMIGVIFSNWSAVILFPQSAVKLPTQKKSNVHWNQFEFLLGKLYFFSKNQIDEDEQFSVKIKSLRVMASSGIVVQSWQNILVQLSQNWKIFSGNDLLFSGTNFIIKTNKILRSDNLWTKILISSWIIETKNDIFIKYNEDLKSYLVNQIGSDAVLNPTINGLTEKFLSLMFSISQKKYGNNLLNYHSFWEFFEEDNNDDFIVENKEDMKEIQKSMEDKTMEGIGNTKIFEWLEGRNDAPGEFYDLVLN